MKLRLNSEKSVQYCHVTIGNMPGIDTESQYTVYTVTKKTYIQARRQRELLGRNPTRKGTIKFNEFAFGNFSRFSTDPTDPAVFLCKTDSHIVIVYHQSSG